MESQTRTWILGFLLVVCAATGLRLWGIDQGLPHLMTRPDEEVLLYKTRHPALGSIDLEYKRGHPGVPSAYIFLLWGWGEVGLPVMQALDLAPDGGYLHVLKQAPERILLLQRLVSVLAAVGTVIVLMLLVRREMGTGAALAAGLLVATSFLHVRESHSAKPDVALGFWVMASLGLLARLAERATTGRAAAAGAAIGLGMAMKPPAVLLLAPAWLAAVMGTEGRGLRRVIPPVAIVVGLVAGAVFLATSPDSILNPTTRQQLVGIIYLVFPSLDPTPVVGSTLQTAPAPNHSLLAGALHYYDFTLRHGVGWLVMAASPIGVAWGFASKKRLAVLSATFVTIAFLVFAASPASQPRYMVPLIPPLAVLLIGAAAAACRRLAAPRWENALLALITSVLIAQPLYDSIVFDRIVSRTDTRVLTTQWVRDNVPDGSVVAVSGYVYWTWGDPVLPPSVETVRTSLDPAALDAAGADYLVTHDYPLFSSTIDPDALAALAPRLELLREFDPFVGPREDARFDAQDAYYVPLAGMDTVERPGPVIRIYGLR